MRQEILKKVGFFCREKFVMDGYRPGDRIPFARRVYDEKEHVNVVDEPLTFG